MPCTVKIMTLALAWALSFGAARAAPNPTMAPIAQYLAASREAEIALARSAAPPSISADAQVLAFSPEGYEIAAKGTNGFVCIVQRAWASDFADPEFWNPRLRAPICFNPASARSILPTYLERTRWLLGGSTREQLLERTKSAVAAGAIRPPEDGAMCYMMSKDGYLSESGGHWRPHLMFYTPRDPAGPMAWGANLPGSPVMGGDVGIDLATVFMIPVAKWSDGTAAEPMAM